MDNLSKMIADSVRQAVAEAESKYIGILDGVDGQLDVYKKDIDYKLSQIQLSATDIDTLDKSLRSAMQEIQNRVLADFDTFTGGQKQKQNDFAQKIKEESDTLEAKIRSINESIDDLQTTATGSMKEKLTEFQKTFDLEISNKNIEIDTTISELKQQLDSRLSSISNTYESSRQEVEAQYLEKLKSNVENLEAKSTEQYDRILEKLVENKNQVENSISQLKDFVEKFKSDATSSINTISETTQKAINSEIEQSSEKVHDALSKIQNDIIADLRDFEETIKTKQQSGTSSIDAALAEFNSWKQQIRTQFDESANLYSDELGSFKLSSQSLMEDANQKLLQNLAAYEAKVMERHDELENSITQLQDKTQTSIEEYEGEEYLFIGGRSLFGEKSVNGIVELSKEYYLVKNSKIIKRYGRNLELNEGEYEGDEIIIYII
jgi:hypothetical protein